MNVPIPMGLESSPMAFYGVVAGTGCAGFLFGAMCYSSLSGTFLELNTRSHLAEIVGLQSLFADMPSVDLVFKHAR